MKTPFFSTVSKVILTIALVATGFIVAQSMRTQLNAREAPTYGNNDAGALWRGEREKPRFVGDIDGIFLAPRGTDVPEQYLTNKDICGDNESRAVPWSEAGELDLTLSLPKEYTFLANDLDTVVVACGDTVFNARRTYSFAQTDQRREEGLVTIGRSLTQYDEVDTAVDRPKSLMLAGRTVVIIEPLTDAGIDEIMRAYIPEPFGGDTFVQAFNIPRADFLNLVTLVASSTR